MLAVGSQVGGSARVDPAAQSVSSQNPAAGRPLSSLDWSAPRIVVSSFAVLHRVHWSVAPSALFLPFSSPMCALLASAGAGRVCGSGLPAFITGGAPYRVIGPLCMAEIKNKKGKNGPWSKSCSGILVNRIRCRPDRQWCYYC